MLSLTGELTLLVQGEWVQAIIGLGLQWLRIPQLIRVYVGFSLSLTLRPRYHYYGIAVKESSQYYDVMYSKKGAAWVSETGKKEVSKQTVAYSPRSKLGTLLPEFPNVKDLNLPASLPEEKVSTPAGLLEWVVLPLSHKHTTPTHTTPTHHNHIQHTHTPQPHTQHTYSTHTILTHTTLTRITHIHHTHTTLTYITHTYHIHIHHTHTHHAHTPHSHIPEIYIPHSHIPHLHTSHSHTLLTHTTHAPHTHTTFTRATLTHTTHTPHTHTTHTHHTHIHHTYTHFYCKIVSLKV